MKAIASHPLSRGASGHRTPARPLAPISQKKGVNASGTPARADEPTPDAGLIEYRSWLELLWAQRAAASAG